MTKGPSQKEPEISGPGCKGMFSSSIKAGTSSLTDWGFWSKSSRWSTSTDILRRTITSFCLAHFRLRPSFPLTCRMAPYSRSSTSRGSSPTLGRWFGSEHRKSRLLRPPLQIHTGQAQQKSPGLLRPTVNPIPEETSPRPREDPDPLCIAICRSGPGPAPSPGEH